VTLREAGKHALHNPSTLGRVEAGFVPARAADVLRLLDVYGVTDPASRADLEKLSRDAWQNDWWDNYRGWLASEIIDLAWLEARTRRILDFSSLVLPDLVQTPEYAKAVMRTCDPDADDDDLDLAVEFRTRRQRILTGEDTPEYASIIDESVLHRIVGSRALMRAQLARLLDLADLSHVTLRVLPFAAGAPASSESPFTYLSMHPPLPEMVQLNTEAGAIYIEAPDTHEFDRAYARLERDALTMDDSRDFIKKRMEQLV
jgi:hypothetical protein